MELKDQTFTYVELYYLDKAYKEFLSKEVKKRRNHEQKILDKLELMMGLAKNPYEKYKGNKND